MNEINIVGATKEDADLAAQLTYMAYHKFSYDIFGEVGEAKALVYFKKLWMHKSNRFSYRYSYIAKFDNVPVGLMTCYPSRLIEKLVGSTVWQLICIGKIHFFRHLVTHTENFYYFARNAEILPDEFYVATLSVLPEYRNHGIGAEMLKYARKLTKDENFRRCVLHVSAENNDGVRFYERNGFTKALPFDKPPVYFRMVDSKDSNKG
ncbi:MAG: GNAT family N-acetyltransferase [Defluviitaleaceae bacterium]|nr:GNAT family N-acetyltransferase [Defluviitaleaceae bacterium]